MKNIVWSKVPCGFCEAAKTLLKSKNIEFEERMIGKEWTMEQFLEAVPGAKTVPQMNVFLVGFTLTNMCFNL